MPGLNGDSGDNNVAGTNGADTIAGGLGNDTLTGGAGNDVIYGFGSADQAPDSGRIDVHQIQVPLDTPVFAGAAPGDSNHLYVVEITGQIQILDTTNDTKLATPFLAIPHTDLGSGGERGLLGLAFAPDYATSGKFYVDMVAPNGDIQIVQYTRSASDPNVADPASKKLILTTPHPTNQHYAGWIGFGPDGDLYIATGDGDAGQVASNPAQDPNSLLGKILRIDVNRDDFPNDPSRNYGIPADNPFVGKAGAPEVFALGLRNPFRDSFDPATGRLIIGDVGENSREEIDVIPQGVGGLNFGWATKEGTLGPANPAFTDPVLEYSHGTGLLQGDCVTGGYVYTGPGGAQGLYIFGDFIDGNLFAARLVDGQPTDFTNLNSALRYDGPNQLANVTSFGLDAQGRLYATTVDGHLFRISPSDGAGDGNDSISGGDGDDQLFGGAGDDVLVTGAGHDTVSGGLGADTIVAGQDSNQLSGGAGADVFVFGALPFNAGHVTDFTVGEDKLDLSALLKAAGYTGSDPVADGYVIFSSDGAGGTRVDFDSDGHGPGAPIRVTNLDGVTPGGLTSSQMLTSGAAASPPPVSPPPTSPPPTSPPPSDGQVLTANDTAGQQLSGGAGNDTLNAGHNSVVETGGGGADAFVFGDIPWNAGQITDFTPGTDRLDLSALFRASGYSGSDPIADGYVSLVADGSGGTQVLYDTDGRGAGNTIQYAITDLDHVSPAGLTWAQLSGGGASPPPPVSPPPVSPPPPPSGGQVLQAQDGGSNLQGGAGDDTLIGAHGPDTMTGGAGGDHFVFNELPWQSGQINDFAHGTDKLDFSALLSKSGYTGSDPIADGYIRLLDDGHGDTWVYYDTDGHGTADQWGTFVTTLEHVSPSSVTTADLIGGAPASPPPPPPPPTSPPPPNGQVLQAQDGGSNLQGGAGDDTLIGAHGPDTMTGGAGGDHFVFNELPWQAGQITDFMHGADKLDFSALLSKSGYTGSDPIADGYIKLIDDGQGDTWVYYDTDGHGTADQWGTFVTTLQHVAASSLSTGDLILH